MMGRAIGDNRASDGIYYFNHTQLMSDFSALMLNQSCSYYESHSHRVSRLYESQNIDLTFLCWPTGVRPSSH